MELAKCEDLAPVITFLEILREATKDLQAISFFTRRSPEITIETILGLGSEAYDILSSDPNLLRVCQLLDKLKTQVGKLKRFEDYSLKSLLWYQITKYEIHRQSFTLEAEIQACIDRERVQNVVKSLQVDAEEEKAVRVLKDLEKRLSKGFDRDFQELILRGRVFSILEWLIFESNFSNRAKEHAALVVVALVRFNRDVFVGLVLMGPIVDALISIASCVSIKVLCSLIELIRIPLIDKIELDGETTRIISLLSTRDLSVRVAAMDSVRGIAYFGRKEVIETMLEQGLIEKLLALQRSEHEHNSNESESGDGNETGSTSEEHPKSDMKIRSEDGEIANNWPFSGCVARFAMQVEVGEGLDKKDKTELKKNILKRVREASVSEAEAASVIVELLWGSP